MRDGWGQDPIPLFSKKISRLALFLLLVEGLTYFFFFFSLSLRISFFLVVSKEKWKEPMVMLKMKGLPVSETLKEG